MTLDEIQATHRARFASCTRWIVIETPEGYEVHEWTPAGVAPPSVYPTRRLAAARLLQLMKTGPVAPQTHPEEVCVGTIEPLLLGEN